MRLSKVYASYEALFWFRNGFAWIRVEAPTTSILCNMRVHYWRALRRLDGLFPVEKLLRHGLISIPPRRVYRA
jgi:hypothetical protein